MLFTIFITMLMLITLFLLLISIIFWITPDVDNLKKTREQVGLVKAIMSFDMLQVYLKTIIVLCTLFLILYSVVYLKIRYEFDQYIAPLKLLTTLWSNLNLEKLALSLLQTTSNTASNTASVSATALAQ